MTRLDAVDEELLERPARAREALLAVAPPDDELAEQAVVERRHHVALVDVAVEAHPRTARRDPLRDEPGDGMKFFRRVLGVDAELDGVALDLDVLLRERAGPRRRRCGCRS